MMLDNKYYGKSKGMWLLYIPRATCGKWETMERDSCVVLILQRFQGSLQSLSNLRPSLKVFDFLSLSGEPGTYSLVVECEMGKIFSRLWQCPWT